jgi:hypothetical protein
MSNTWRDVRMSERCWWFQSYGIRRLAERNLSTEVSDKVVPGLVWRWKNQLLLGRLATLWRATDSFVVCVRPFVRLELIWSHWTDFHEISYLRIFKKSVEKIQVFLKSEKKIACPLCEDTYIYDIISLNYLRTRNISDKCCRENQNTYFVFSMSFPKNLSLMRECGKNMIQADRPQMTI